MAACPPVHPPCPPKNGARRSSPRRCRSCSSAARTSRRARSRRRRGSPRARSSRVFPDKDAVVQAVVEAALDPEPTERELGAIDRGAPVRGPAGRSGDHHAAPRATASGRSWRASARATRTARRRPTSRRSRTSSRRSGAQLRTDPATAARQLRAVTLAVSNPVLFSGDPMTAHEIVTVFLHGILARRPHAWKVIADDPPPAQLTCGLRALARSRVVVLQADPGVGIAAAAVDQRDIIDKGILRGDNGYIWRIGRADARRHGGAGGVLRRRRLLRRASGDGLRARRAGGPLPPRRWSSRRARSTSSAPRRSSRASPTTCSRCRCSC